MLGGQLNSSYQNLGESQDFDDGQGVPCTPRVVNR